MAASTLSTEYPGQLVPPEIVIDLHPKIVTTHFVESRLKIYARQGKCTFHASARGHEKLQIGMTLLLKPRHDWFFTYCRDKGVPIALGMPPRDLSLAMLTREGDPNSNRRNMPEHFSWRELHLVSPTACTETQFLPAVGLSRVLVTDGSDAVVYVSSGEAVTSLDASIVRVTAKDSFVPSAANPERAILPSMENLERSVERVLRC